MDVLGRDRRWPIVTRAKSVVNILAFDHGMMNWWPVRHQHVVLFLDILRTAASIDKPLTKNTNSDISRVSDKPFSMGCPVEVVVKRGNAAMVHTELDIALSLTIFVSWGVCTVWPATPYPTQFFCRKYGRYNHRVSLF